MFKTLYDQLSNLQLLRRAWHLVRDDSRGDFTYDPFRYSDYGFRLDEHLQAIASAIQARSYYPKPARKIDIPKSALAVRPGAALAVEDRIVLFAIAVLIAPRLDKKLSAGVYSYRVKKEPTRKELFETNEKLAFPFLPKRTVREIEIAEPWYEAWPSFIKDLQDLDISEYPFMVVSDITAYFENIDLSVLTQLLLMYLPREAELVHFLTRLLQYWAWPAMGGVTAPRGIPQGFGVSSFLGNLYLLPLDQAFTSSVRIGRLKYFRYMDDVKILAKTRRDARAALMTMNEQLRSLRLNIQSGKTHVLLGDEITQDLVDVRLEEANSINHQILELKKQKLFDKSTKARKISELRVLLRRARKISGIYKDKDLRLYRRIITNFSALDSSALVPSVLKQLEGNTDSRLLRNAVRYLQNRDRCSRIGYALLNFLENEEGDFFDYQLANFAQVLRHQNPAPPGANTWALKQLRSKNGNWYLRQQSAQLYCAQYLNKAQRAALLRLYADETVVEVRKVMAAGLCQCDPKLVRELLSKLMLDPEPQLQRFGFMCHSLVVDPIKAKAHLSAASNQYLDDKLLLDRIFELECMSLCEDQSFRSTLLARIKVIRARTKREFLRRRLEAMTKRLTPVK